MPFRRLLQVASSPLAQLVLTCAVGLGLRIALSLTTFDAPGDGPTRAVEAYQWSQHPWLPISGVWPPGFLLIHGAANWLLPRPDVASRIVNVAFGTLTIPALYFLARRSFGPAAAMIGAAALAVWPLHVELSASSLSEAGFVFALTSGLVLVDVGLETRRRSFVLALGLACIMLATMTRYEAWWFLPIVALYAWSRRGPPTGIGVGATLAAFPLGWLAGNQFAHGDPLAGFTAAVRGAALEGETGVDAASAASQLMALVDKEVGWPIAVLLALGVMVAVQPARRVPPTRVLYLAVVIVFWSASLYFAAIRGETMFSRYLVLGIVLLFPMMWLPFQTLRPRVAAIAGVTLFVGMLGSFESTERYDKRTWVTENAHVEMREVASWISSSEFKDDFILLTDMGWTASYLAMHWPEIADHRAIVSNWVGDQWVREHAVDRAPGLLVTRATDIRQRARVEEALGWQISRAALVHEHGAVEIYDLERAGIPRLEVTTREASAGRLSDRGKQSPR